MFAEQYVHGASSRPLVLLAEDDPNDELLLTLAFAKVAPEVNLRSFTDGEELMRFLARKERSSQTSGRDASLLLLDLRMPRLDGFSVLHWLVDHPEERPGRIVVLTGVDRREDLDRAVLLGVDGYLIKPQDTAQLKNVVQSLGCFWRTPVTDGSGSHESLSTPIRILSSARDAQYSRQNGPDLAATASLNFRSEP